MADVRLVSARAGFKLVQEFCLVHSCILNSQHMAKREAWCLVSIC